MKMQQQNKNRYCGQQRTELAFGKLNWWCLSVKKGKQTMKPQQPLHLTHAVTRTCPNPWPGLHYSGFHQCVQPRYELSFVLCFTNYFPPSSPTFFLNSYILPIPHQSTSNYSCSNFSTRTSLTNHLLQFHSMACLPFLLLSTESLRLSISIF